MDVDSRDPYDSAAPTGRGPRLERATRTVYAWIIAAIAIAVVLVVLGFVIVLRD